MIADLLFWMFGTGVLGGAALIVGARNPMVGVMGMLVAFLNACGLMLLFGAEFLALLLVMVYVGAVAVMFLFVLMTIDIDFAKLREGFAPYLPAGLLVLGVLAAELVFAAKMGLFMGVGSPVPAADAPQNVVALGGVLFTTYALPFQLAGLVLLVAMIGAIVLTHEPRVGLKRQAVPLQLKATKADSLKLAKPALGKGMGRAAFVPPAVAPKAPKGGK